MRPLISACLIVKNEESCIERCLSSIKQCVDEIIVVDTGSSDSTVTRVKNFTDRVYYFPWCDDFSAARNASLSYASYDWVLIIDADEELDNGIDLKKLIEDNPHANAFTFKEIDVLPDKTPVSITASNERLFLRKNAYYNAAIHNTLHIPDIRVTAAAIGLFHYGYNLDDGALQTKYEPRIPFLQQRCSDHPSFESEYYLASTYMMLKRYTEAASTFTALIEKYDVFSRNETVRVGISLCVICYTSHDYSKGLTHASMFYSRTQRHVFLLFKALFTAQIGKADESESYLQELIPDDDFLMVPDFKRHISYAHGMNAFNRSDMAKAQAYFNNYIASHESGESQLMATAELYATLNRPDALEPLAQDLEKSPNPRAWALRALYAEHTGDLAAAAAWYTKTIDVAPDSFLFNALGVVYFRLKLTEKAIEMMENALNYMPVDVRAFDNLILISRDVLHDDAKARMWQQQRDTMKGGKTHES